MPLRVTQCDDPPRCQGYAWHVRSEQFLAQLVARLVLGHYRHVARVLREARGTVPVPEASEIDRAIQDLAPPGKDEYRWHRDGWVFQMISWIAAHVTADGEVAASIPHPRKTAKGFDAVIVQVAASGNDLTGVIICEDKATENSRQTIREQVWPDFEDIEAGKRDRELRSEVTAILERYRPQNVDELVKRIHWDSQRRYRVAITIGDTHNSQEGRSRLFRGYSKKVRGGLERRRGETFHLVDLRSWMDHFCELVVLEIESMRSHEDV